ncbi:MAG: hypothetical protein EA369_04130 [Bradymonadales bacterium]|nr:MAG: hypothetical protein EA369_04130 [Bradymonadales bacterium]
MFKSLALAVVIGTLAISLLWWSLHELAHSRRSTIEQTQLDSLSWSLCHQTTKAVSQSYFWGNRGIQGLQTSMNILTPPCIGLSRLPVLGKKFFAKCLASFSALSEAGKLLEQFQNHSILVLWPANHFNLREQLRIENQIEVQLLSLSVRHKLNAKWDSHTKQMIPEAFDRFLSERDKSLQRKVQALFGFHIRWPYALQTKESQVYQLSAKRRPQRYRADQHRSFFGASLSSACRVLWINENFEVERMT